MITVIPVESKKQLAQFIDFPHELYKGDPNYVPELFIAQRDLLTPGKHPFHKHSLLKMFLALKDGEIAGRIAAIQNNNHNKFNNANDGFFGFFDVVDDYHVAEMLLLTAEKWLKNNGLDTCIGPVNFSTNETCGMLVEGYDSPPTIMMTYNKPYYNTFMTQAGFSKKTDLLAWRGSPTTAGEKPLRLMAPLNARLNANGIVVRKVNLKQFKSESQKIKEVYNKAWDKNLGFVPMTDEEFDYLAKDMKLLLDPEFCLVAEKDNKLVGFALCLPDINQIYIKIKKGRLFPTGIFKLLTQQKKIDAVRVIALGVLDDYRRLGIESVFYAKIIEKAKEKKLRQGEASWVLEGNDMMNKAMEHINFEVYKKYRIYEKEL